MRGGFYLSDGRRAQYRTIHDLERAKESDSEQYADWEILPQCQYPDCDAVAEFVKPTGSALFQRKHLCYEHGKDESDKVPCLCKPMPARNYM